jgi:aspartate aminotransferase/N-succinyldiaminopimelate aminotransferase
VLRGLDVHPDHVVVTAGATHGVSLALNAIVDRGDEVIVASPQWLFTTGLVEAAGAVPIEVPIFSGLAYDPGFDFVSALDRAVSDRTRAVYFNSPNNPTGVCLGSAQLGALAEWAAARDLWVITDNAYENFDFTDGGFRDVALDAPGRTFSVYTFSKTYSMPGYRVGYTVCPPAASARLRKWALYSVYSVATVSQHAAACALAVPPAELAQRSLLARRSRDLTTSRLAVPHNRIDGGMYAWLDLRDWAGGQPAGFVKACLEAGVGIAPGHAFGAHCSDWARLCFTAVPPEQLIPALDAINHIYTGEPS